MTNGVQIRRVDGKNERKQFLRFPWTVYEGDPYWVPPLLAAAERVLSPASNPFFQQGEIELYVAWRNGQPVGRIAAIIDRAHVERHSEKAGFWGFFEAVNDADVAGALFDAASAHLRQRGMAVMRGPFGPNINGECGLLVEGFDSMPYVLMPYNPPYYQELVEKAGFACHMELHAFRVEDYQVAPEQATVKRFERLAAAVHKRQPGLSVRTIDMSRYDDEVLALGRLFNTARRDNWGFVPASDAEIRTMARDLKRIVDPDLVLICEHDGKPVGCIMGIPDLSPVLKKMNGRMFPLGWLHFLLGKRRVRAARIFGAGVLPEYRSAGVTVLLIVEFIRRGLHADYNAGEISWVSASNVRSLGVIEKAIRLHRYKTYRIYERAL